MAYRVRVQLKDAAPAYSGPFETRSEAEQELQKVSAVLNARSPREQMLGTPDVAWMSAMGQNIVGADIEAA